MAAQTPHSNWAAHNLDLGAAWEEEHVSADSRSHNSAEDLGYIPDHSEDPIHLLAVEADALGSIRYQAAVGPALG